MNGDYWVTNENDTNDLFALKETETETETDDIGFCGIVQTYSYCTETDKQYRFPLGSVYGLGLCLSHGLGHCQCKCTITLDDKFRMQLM